MIAEKFDRRVVLQELTSGIEVVVYFFNNFSYQIPPFGNFCLFPLLSDSFELINGEVEIVIKRNLVFALSS